MELIAHGGGTNTSYGILQCTYGPFAQHVALVLPKSRSPPITFRTPLDGRFSTIQDCVSTSKGVTGCAKGLYMLLNEALHSSLIASSEIHDTNSEYK